MLKIIAIDIEIIGVVNFTLSLPLFMYDCFLTQAEMWRCKYIELVS